MKSISFLFIVGLGLAMAVVVPAFAATPIGQEKAVPNHLQDGSEYTLPLLNLLKHGELLFKARWTTQDGAGRPMSKGTGAPLSDAFEPLFFPRNMNRISGPDANSCAGCHNTPWPGGGGDFVANVFVLGQRFDFATFDPADMVPTKGVVDENGLPTTLQSMANSRSTLGMFGSGYMEMLARQITARLQALRDGLATGQSVNLLVNGIDFGKLARLSNGTWDTSQAKGLPPPSLRTTGANDPPSLLILPFHQAGAVVSLRVFTNNALNHHHGIQTTERFGQDLDADQDGVSNEMTRADTTALTVYQATLPAPGRVIPANPDVEKAVIMGEDKFVAVGCSNCHIPALPLVNGGWMYSEPGPYNPSGNLRFSDVSAPLTINLNGRGLPLPRLKNVNGVTWVPAFTDFKLHDITSGTNDPNREPLNMQFPAGSTKFRAGNSQFITRKLWGVANEPPYYHHGLYSTLREAVEAHDGEARATMQAYFALSRAEQDAIIEFLKTLQVLSPSAKAAIVDETGKPRTWRDFPYDLSRLLQ